MSASSIDLSLPVRVTIYIQLQELDGAIGTELTNDGEPRYEHPGGDQDAVVVAVWGQPRQVIESDSETFDDAEQFEHLKVVRRGFASWTPFRRQLATEVLEEPRGPPDRPA
jgi:hypothetical protein